MYEPIPHAAAYPPPYHYDWPERPRRRLNRKGYAVLLVAFALLCGLLLGAVKLGLVLWQSPAAARVATGAAKIGTAAADAAMKEAKVPKEVRAAVKEEAAALGQEILDQRAEAHGAEPSSAAMP